MVKMTPWLPAGGQIAWVGATCQSHKTDHRNLMISPAMTQPSANKATTMRAIFRHLTGDRDELGFPSIHSPQGRLPFTAERW
jgi:hypothetical protein